MNYENELLEKIGINPEIKKILDDTSDVFNTMKDTINDCIIQDSYSFEMPKFKENNYQKRICDAVERIDNRGDILIEIVSDIKIGIDKQLEQGQLEQEDYNQIKELLKLLNEGQQSESLIKEIIKDMSKDALKVIIPIVLMNLTPKTY